MSGQVFAMLVMACVAGFFSPRAGFVVLLFNAVVIYSGGPW